MTDKVQKIKDWISKEQDGLMDAQGNFEYPEHGKEPELVDEDDLPTKKDYRERYKRIAESEEFRKNHDGMSIGDIVPVEGEEPASEDLNTESMVESYKQRLISQANGMKNSPLIDMCLASYKHGINDTLDTLNLSNVERTVKDWKESVGEDLEEAAMQYAKLKHKDATLQKIVSWDFKAGAKWQKEHLWKPADGDNLPIIDREVIALLDNGKVVFAHRPPEFWDGKNIITGKVTRNYPKTYDKGGWNIPDVKFWLDVELPKEIEL